MSLPALNRDEAPAAGMMTAMRGSVVMRKRSGTPCGGARASGRRANRDGVVCVESCAPRVFSVGIDKLGPIGIDRAGKVFGGASWGVLATQKARIFL